MPLSDEENFHFSTVLIAARSKSSYLLEVKIAMLNALPLGSMSKMTSTRPCRPSFLAALGYSGLPQPLMQVPRGLPGGREGLPPRTGFVGFGTDPEPLPEPGPPGPPGPGPGKPAVADLPNRPEPSPNGSEEGRSPFLLAPDSEFDALPPGLPPPGLPPPGPPESRFPKSPIAFRELPPPPGLVAVTGEPAPGDRCMGPEGGFNGSEEGSPLPAEADGERGLFFSGLSGDLGFAVSVKSGRLPPPLGREALTGGSLFGGSGEGVSGSLAIGLLGVSGELKSSVGGGEGSTGVGGVSVNGGSCLISGGGVAATGGSSGIGGGVAATGCSSGIGGGVVATGGSSGIGGGVVATGCSSGIGGGVAATGCSSGGVGSGGGSGFNVSGGGDTFS